LIHDLRPTVSDPIITDFEEKKNLHDPPVTLETASTCSLHADLLHFTRPHPSSPPQSLRTGGHTLLLSPVPSAPNPLPHVRPDLLVVGELGIAAMEVGGAASCLL
jgi:hypothetical protein